jgi:hypothetical protein
MTEYYVFEIWHNCMWCRSDRHYTTVSEAGKALGEHIASQFELGFQLHGRIEHVTRIEFAI